MSIQTAIWVAVVVGLVAAGAVASYVLSESFDAEETPRDVTQAVATLVAVGDCPWGEATCILAQGIERALQRGNIDAVMDLGVPGFYICPGGGRGPMPLCEGSGPDEGKRGFPVTRRFSGETVVDEAAARQRIVDFVRSAQPGVRDAIGPGGLKLYAFSCDRLAVRVQPVSCAHVGIILSAILGEGAEQRREVLVFWAVGGFAGKTLPFTEVSYGAVRPQEVSVLFEDGGELADLGDVHVIDQARR
jgi:hypothetical protein